ncbi:apoptosis-inducing factor 3-like isoform X2 [Lytechinus variegatus]|uniref:apoptosis-inducing factor 3-like isoform X2 n=1 Tax=Lytechinus variegatus TaxID=7654 RepID=UPI001BB190E2|nr:apoptosis-inducing factor 3-like isoform X2 [Lytechinus variegatus]
MGGCSSKDGTVSQGDVKVTTGGGGGGGANGTGPGPAPVKPSKVLDVESVVCKVDDMKDGEMREVDVGKGKALLVKELGEFSAIGHKCTHYGAPLVKGALCNGRVRCPWHGACFSTKTGDIEDFPGLDSVPKYEVRIDGDKVIVSGNSKELASHKRVKKMCTRSPDDDKTVLIIGGGAASITCAETLRQEGFKGQVIIATKEKHLPYDRPKLSKAMNSKPESLSLRNADFFTIYDITMMTEKEATSVDTVLNSVTFLDGENISFDYLLIATGGKPRTLNVTGNDLDGVCLLRSPEDGNTIAEIGQGKNVVIVGTSFIGMEVAAYLSDKAASITVIGRGSAPYKASLGEKVGKALQKLAESKGVRFVMENGVSEFKGEGGRLKKVILKDGQTIAADVCVLGVGVTPATDFLSDSELKMTDRGAVCVDKYMKTNKTNIYAAGDIASFPLAMAENREVNIGHWQIAHAHGRVAALNMLDQKVEMETVPFFWTQIFGKSVRYAGFNEGFDDVVVTGDLDELRFVAYYIKDDIVVAMASMNSDPIVSQFAEVLASGRELNKSEIQSDPSQWSSKL